MTYYAEGIQPVKTAVLAVEEVDWHIFATESFDINSNVQA